MEAGPGPVCLVGTSCPCTPGVSAPGRIRGWETRRWTFPAHEVLIVHGGTPPTHHALKAWGFLVLPRKSRASQCPLQVGSLERAGWARVWWPGIGGMKDPALVSLRMQVPTLTFTTGLTCS